MNRLQHRLKFLPAPALDRRAHQRRLLGRSALHHVDQGQCRFALPQVVAQVLAGMRGVAGIVQHVVDQLERRPQVHAVAREAPLELGARLAEYGASVTAKLWAFSSCSTSPSAIALVASASTAMTRMLRTATIIWKAREYRKSPTSTLAAFPNSALAVLRPRRSSDSSTTSSCSSVAV